MSFLSPISCMMGRHDPRRRDVEWDGRDFVGKCRHCGKPIVRVTHRTWREREAEGAASGS